MSIDRARPAVGSTGGRLPENEQARAHAASPRSSRHSRMRGRRATRPNSARRAQCIARNPRSAAQRSICLRSGCTGFRSLHSSLWPCEQVSRSPLRHSMVARHVSPRHSNMVAALHCLAVPGISPSCRHWIASVPPCFASDDERRPSSAAGNGAADGCERFRRLGRRAGARRGRIPRSCARTRAGGAPEPRRAADRARRRRYPRCEGGGARRPRRPPRRACGGRLSAVDTRPRRAPCNQRGRHAHRDGGVARRGRRTDRLHEQRRHAGTASRRRAGRRVGPACGNGGRRRVQAQQDRGGAARGIDDCARCAAGSHRQSVDADRAARHPGPPPRGGSSSRRRRDEYRRSSTRDSISCTSTTSPPDTWRRSSAGAWASGTSWAARTCRLLTCCVISQRSWGDGRLG